jgi:hypothetical protein
VRSPSVAAAAKDVVVVVAVDRVPYSLSTPLTARSAGYPGSRGLARRLREVASRSGSSGRNRAANERLGRRRLPPSQSPQQQRQDRAHRPPGPLCRRVREGHRDSARLGSGQQAQSFTGKYRHAAPSVAEETGGRVERFSRWLNRRNFDEPSFRCACRRSQVADRKRQANCFFARLKRRATNSCYPDGRRLARCRLYVNAINIYHRFAWPLP